jgi:hypothetical protein
VLVFLSVVTKIATTPEMPGKTHVTEKVRKRMDYSCSTSHSGIRVIVFIFSQWKHYIIDSRIINEWRVLKLGRKLWWGNDKDIHWVN